MLFVTSATLMQAQVNRSVSYFHLRDVRLLESPFRHAEELNKAYLLEMNVDRLLAPFHREAGLAPRAGSYTSWESSGLHYRVPRVRFLLPLPFWPGSSVG